MAEFDVKARKSVSRGDIDLDKKSALSDQLTFRVGRCLTLPDPASRLMTMLAVISVRRAVRSVYTR